MSKLPKPSLKSIVAASVPSAPPAAAIVQLAPTAQRNTPTPQLTLKERAKQLSVYLEPPVYDQLREIAYSERTKIHTLVPEGLDLLFRDRGARSIRDLDGRR